MLFSPWEFSRQEYWSGLPYQTPGDLLNPGIELRSPALQVDPLPSEPPGKAKIEYISGQMKFEVVETFQLRVCLRNNFTKVEFYPEACENLLKDIKHMNNRVKNVILDRLCISWM